jgi:hypothetical protein
MAAGVADHFGSLTAIAIPVDFKRRFKLTYLSTKKHGGQIDLFCRLRWRTPGALRSAISAGPGAGQWR